MNRHDPNCHLEEELLMHLLEEDSPEDAIRISNHLASCRSCKAAFSDLVETERAIRSWEVEDLPAESWELMKIELIRLIRRDSRLVRSRGIVGTMLNFLQPAWEYAIKSPVPAICFVGAVIAFAAQSAIGFFRLQPIMPTAGQVIEVLRKAL
jgi:anti-sigma factor RsiW